MESSSMLLLVLFVSVAILRSQCRKPNIIFILADDLGYDDLEFDISHQIKTPSLNKFRNEGQFLKYYYAQSVCSPSRAALLTGLYPIHTGINTYIGDSEAIGVYINQTLISEILLHNNYETHIVGKWHIGFYKWSMTPTYRGFKSFYGYYNAAEDYYTHKAAGYYDFRDDIGLNCGPNCSNVAINAYQNYSSYLFSQRAIEIIKNHSKIYSPQLDNPLFLYLAYQGVHAPAECPSNYVDAYDGIIHNSTRKLFAGMVSCVDEGIANITDVLQQYGYLDNNTIIIFSSDNGGPIPTSTSKADSIGSSNFPLRGGKHTVWEGGTRVNGIFWTSPDIIDRSKVAGSNYTQFMHITDWFATLCSAAGINYTQYLNGYDIDGIDQWNGLCGKNNGDDKYFEYRNNLYYGCDAHADPGNHTGFRYQWLKVLNKTGGIPSNWGSYNPPNDGMNRMNINTDSVFPLYNISDDECEYYDISENNTFIVDQLVNMMIDIQNTAIPQQQSDINCPQNISHPVYPIVGGVWQPWCGVY